MIFGRKVYDLYNCLNHIYFEFPTASQTITYVTFCILVFSILHMHFYEISVFFLFLCFHVHAFQRALFLLSL
jgi:hypothetical protein